MRLIRPGPIEQNPLEKTELPHPKPGPGQVLIRVKACGICHTDLHTVEGEIVPPHYPITPGHQVVGLIEGVGEGVRQWKDGDRVGIPWLHHACGQCPACERGEENLCPQAIFTGFHVDGGYSEWMLADARYALPLPDAFSDQEIAPLLCGGIIGYRSLHKADLEPGERLGLVGFGASAHLAIQVARYWDCEIYVFTRSKGHRDLAQELGAA